MFMRVVFRRPKLSPLLQIYMLTLTGRRSVFVILLVLQHSILCSSIPLLSRVYDVAHVLQIPVDLPIRQQLHHRHVPICQAHFMHRHIFILFVYETRIARIFLHFPSFLFLLLRRAANAWQLPRWMR